MSSKCSAVIIENKIYADDQDEQLWRYQQRM
ncbi:PD-(D/E)XK nuclease family protein [Pseudomonas gelidaquae]|nr:PD-(D/E)XK nuclease family protein [Pseudomonas sp. IB20]